MEKEEFKRFAKKKIDEIFAEIEELETRKVKNEKDVERSKEMDQYKQKLAELKAKRDDLKAKYQDLEKDSEAKWEESKKAFSSASDSFREGINEIRSLFK